MSDYTNFGNYHAWKEVDEWLTWQYNSTSPPTQRLSPDAVLFLTGNAGTGKTFLVETLCHKNNIDIVMIHSHNCENSKELRDRIFKACTTRLVDNIQCKTTSKLILLDEMDTLIHMDRMVLSVLAEILSGGTLPRVPIVAIGSAQSEKKLSTFKSKCAHVSMFPVNTADIFLFLKHCLATRPSNASSSHNAHNAGKLMEIAETSNGSLSFAKQQLEMASQAPPSTRSQGMDSSLTCFRYIYGDNELHHIVQLLTEDPWLNPLRFHENLIKELGNRKGTAVEKARVYAGILRLITEWDAFMSVGEDSIAIEHLARGIQHNLKRLLSKKKTKKEERGGATDDLQGFTKLFSQMSIQKKHERTLYNGSSFPWHDAQIFFQEYK